MALFPSSPPPPKFLPWKQSSFCSSQKAQIKYLEGGEGRTFSDLPFSIFAKLCPWYFCTRGICPICPTLLVPSLFPILKVFWILFPSIRMLPACSCSPLFKAVEATNMITREMANWEASTTGLRHIT